MLPAVCKFSHARLTTLGRCRDESTVESVYYEHLCGGPICSVCQQVLIQTLFGGFVFGPIEADFTVILMMLLSLSFVVGAAVVVTVVTAFALDLCPV